MKPLTFAGFLKKYVQELSGQKTVSVRKLAKAAELKSPRLREPLLLFLFLTHTSDSAEHLLQGHPKLFAQCGSLKAYRSAEHLLKSLENCTADLPEGFLKAYRSYRSVRDRCKNEQWTKSLMRKRILQLQAEKHVTDYRIYTALRLNPGNYSAFMRQEKTDRLSLDKARKMLSYLENSSEPPTTNLK